MFDICRVQWFLGQFDAEVARSLCFCVCGGRGCMTKKEQHVFVTEGCVSCEINFSLRIYEH